MYISKNKYHNTLFPFDNHTEYLEILFEKLTLIVFSQIKSFMVGYLNIQYRSYKGFLDTSL